MARRAPRTSRTTRAFARVLACAAVLLLGLAATANAGVVVDLVGLVVTEGDAAGTYTVSLDAEPSAPVTVRFESDGQLEPIPDLVIEPEQWDEAHEVHVTASDDDVAEGTHAATILHVTTSEDDGFDDPTPASPQTVSIIDDDFANLLLVPPALPIGEGSSATWHVSLTSQPIGTVYVAFTGDDQVGIGGGTVSFDADDWSVPKAVPVLALGDDVVEGPHSGTVEVEVSADDPVADEQYALLVVPPITVTIEDDDEAGIVLDPPLPGPLHVQEGSPPATYRIRLASQPTHEVEIDIDPLVGEVTVAPDTVTFQPGDWNEPQEIQVTAVQDTDPEPSPHDDALAHTANSDDDEYAALTLPDLPIAVGDDDSPNVIITEPANMTLDEGDAQGTERLLAVRLSMPPTGEVRVQAISDGQAFLMVTNILSFDEDNWNVDQFLIVRAAEDDYAEAPLHQARISFAILANDPQYSTLVIPPRTFQVIDDDVAYASMECQPGANWDTDATGAVPIAESPDAPDHSVTCLLTLGTPPAADVVVTATATPGGQVQVEQPTVTIEAGSYESRPFTFTAVDDAIAEARPHHVDVNFAVTSTDAVYGALNPGSFRLAIADDDEAGLEVKPDGAVPVAEGAAAEVRLSLRSQPTAPVSINVGVHPQLELVPPATGTLLFTPTDWHIEQHLRFTAIDDDIAEDDPHDAPLTLTLTSGDAMYGGLTVPAIQVKVDDDDVPGLSVSSESDGPIAEGGSRSYELALMTRPAANVTVKFERSDQFEIEQELLTFTPDDWDEPQKIDLTTRQDTVFEGTHTAPLRFITASSDPIYAPGGRGAPRPYDVVIGDDEEGGATIVESEGATAVAEAGGPDTYTIALKAEPTADVTIRIDPGSQVTVEPAALSFSPGTWSVPQTVTVTAVQDELDEQDPHDAPIVHTVETSAAGWAGIVVPKVVAKVTDDDDAKIILTQSEDNTRVVEGAKNGDDITFALTTQPSADVTITTRSDEQLQFDTTPIVFTPANWKEKRTLTVRARDDKELEGDHVSTLTFTVGSTDPKYGKLTIPAIAVAIVDNDSDVTIAPDGDAGGGLDDGPATRKPRGNRGSSGERTRAGRGSSGGSSGGGSTRRSDSGAERTDGGSERTDAGLGLATGSARRSKDDEEQDAPKIRGEVVSAAEQEPKEPAKPKGPSAVAKAAAWAKRNWELIAPVAGVALMGASAATFFLKGDPMRGAERAITGKGGGAPAPGGGDDRPDARRAKKKKRRKDEGDDAGPARKR